MTREREILLDIGKTHVANNNASLSIHFVTRVDGERVLYLIKVLNKVTVLNTILNMKSIIKTADIAVLVDSLCLVMVLKFRNQISHVRVDYQLRCGLVEAADKVI